MRSFFLLAMVAPTGIGRRHAISLSGRGKGARTMQSRILAATLALGSVVGATVLTSSASRASSILFQSIPTFDDAGALYSCSSCNGSNSVFDIFTLASDATITNVSFAEYAATVPFYPISSVTLNIFSTPTGLPLFSQTFTSGQITLLQPLVPGLNNVGEPTAIVGISPTALSLTSGSYLISFYGPNLAPEIRHTGANLGFATSSIGTDDPFASTSARDFTLGFVLEGDPTNAVGVPGPVVGAGLPGLLLACASMFAWYRRRKPAASSAANI